MPDRTPERHGETVTIRWHGAAGRCPPTARNALRNLILPGVRRIFIPCYPAEIANEY
jgi:hypothetical protein